MSSIITLSLIYVDRCYLPLLQVFTIYISTTIILYVCYVYHTYIAKKYHGDTVLMLTWQCASRQASSARVQFPYSALVLLVPCFLHPSYSQFPVAFFILGTRTLIHMPKFVEKDLTGDMGKTRRAPRDWDATTSQRFATCSTAPSPGLRQGEHRTLYINTSLMRALWLRLLWLRVLHLSSARTKIMIVPPGYNPWMYISLCSKKSQTPFSWIAYMRLIIQLMQGQLLPGSRPEVLQVHWRTVDVVPSVGTRFAKFNWPLLF